MSQEARKLSVIFFLLILLWCVSAILRMQLSWFVVLAGIGIYFITKYRKATRKDCLIALLLAVLMISNPFMGIFSIPAYVGAMCMFRTYSNKIVFIRTGKAQTALSVLLGASIGTILGVINILLPNASFQFSFSIQWVLNAFSAGIGEEILFRFFMFAICCSVLKNKKLSIVESILCYLIMIVPHVLLHFDFATINLADAALSSILFGLPFTLLQRKRDYASAALSHTLVDLIRFCAFGF